MNIVDIGSVGGLPDHLRRHADKVMLFDPFQKDKNDSENIYNCCVFDKEEQRRFYVYNKLQCSSLYKLNYRWIKEQRGSIPQKYLIKQEMEVKCVPLDSLLSSDHQYQFLKIDAEGAELGILGGAKQCISGFSYLEIESYLVPMFVNAPLFPEVKKMLESLGFNLVGHLRNMKKNLKFNEWIFINKGADPGPLRKIYRKYHNVVI